MTSKNKSILAVTTMSSSATTEAGKFVTRQAIQQLSFWGRLKEKEQTALVEEARQLAAAAMVNGASELAIGERLSNSFNILRPYRGAYGELCKRFKFTERTARRYREGYENARANVPEGLLKGAMARGMRLLGYSEAQPLGVYTEAFRKYPPPKSLESADADPKIVDQYLTGLDQTRMDIKRAKARAKKEGKEVETEASQRKDYKTELTFSYRRARNALSHIPARRKRDFLDTLVGYLLTEIGVGSKTSFSPEAIPEKVRRERGAPRGPRLVPELEGNLDARQARVM